MDNYWRYFRLGGDPPGFGGVNLFSVAIHHGGRFHSNGGMNRVYRGGFPVVFVDGVDPEKVSVTGFNYWANDLGYRGGPIGYWFRIPGSEPGTGYLPITSDADAMDMIQFIPANNRVLDIYIVCLAGRRYFSDWELDSYDDEIDHLSFFGHYIEDLPLTDDEEPNHVADEETNHVPDEEPKPAPEAAPGPQQMPGFTARVDVDSLFSNEQLMEEIFGDKAGPVSSDRGGPRTRSSTGPRTRSSTGIRIREPDGSQVTSASTPAANATRDKGKGKEKVVEEPKRKKGRPRKQRPYDLRSGGECSRPAPAVHLHESSDDSDDSEDVDYDAIADSDYELDEEEDEAAFNANVDGNTKSVPEFDEMGFDGNISDADDADSDGLQSVQESESDGEDKGMFKVKHKKRLSEWIEFNEKTDMKNPKFSLGMVFPNCHVFRHAVKKHVVQTKKELRFPRNTKHQILVRCKTSPACPFWMYASSPSTDNPSLQIRTFRPQHTCTSIAKRVHVYHCHAPFLAEEYKSIFLSNSKWSREGVQSAVNREFGMEIGYQLAYRAKARAVRIAHGTIEDQYNNLESYAHELKRRNPGSSVWIQTELEGEVARFKRIYICLAALKEGWMAGCRPIIGLDRCHLKGVYKGQLLSAVGIDGNNGIYPIAWAIVEQESRDSWTWFLSFLKEDLMIHHSSHYAFISDKQKGLEQAIKDLFPDAEHRHCVRHLHNNFKGDGHTGLELKQKLWAVARATTMTQYKKEMEALQKASFTAWQWCVERPAKHWSKSHFAEKFHCDILLNNHSESFNKSILDARKKPILPCLEDIRVACMVRLANRKNSAARWRSKVGPRIEKLLKKNASWANDYRPLESSNFRFELHRRGVACESGVIAQHSVQLDTKSCTCRRWDLCGIPCGHVISAIYSKGWSPDDFVAEWYTQKKYMEAYDVMINPIAGVAEWEHKERKIAPPLYRRQPGRPKSKRTREPSEAPPPPEVEKLPRSYYSQVKCGICNKKGHNKRTCQKRNEVPNEGQAVQEEEPNVQQPVPETNMHQEQSPTEAPQPTQESNPQDADQVYMSQASSVSNPQVADQVFSQASSVPNINNHSNHGNDNVNVNVNVNLNVHVSMNDESGANNDSSQEPSVAPKSSGKRYKMKARRMKPRKSPRLAAASDRSSQNVQVPKNQVQRRLWKP